MGFFELLLPLIVALPLAGAIVNGVFGRRAPKSMVTAVAVGVVGIAFLLSVTLFYGLTQGGDDARVVSHVYDWFTLRLGPLTVPIGVTFVMDRLSGVMALFVTGIGTLIHIYSTGYMSEDPSYTRFFTYLNLFMASMLILVLAGNMPLLFVGWEGVGLCSYLLIGFWFENTSYAQAGKKAFIVNRIGDFGVLMGMFILMKATGTVEFDKINAAAKAGDLARPFRLPVEAALNMRSAVVAIVVTLLVLGAVAFVKRRANIRPAAFWIPAVLLLGFLGWYLPWSAASVAPLSIATAACLFLFLGCTGKSAQIPLFVWLPDAMAGPTPVSALIHAATMVTAGVYLCARLSYVFIAAPTALMIISVVGALTALLAASIALVQNHMKRILAYSTVSQLGFMFAAVGAGAFSAGFFHVFTHAFFKACLFLGAGAVMHAVHAHGDADIRLLGGMKKHLPVVHWTFFVSCLAIAGVPPFSGFFSKDEILLGVLHSQTIPGYSASVSYFVFAVLVLAATMTAFYMFRLYFLTFAGEYRSAKGHGHGDDGHGADAHAHDEHAYDPHPHAPEAAIAWPLRILGVGAFIAGALNLEPILHPFHVHLPEPWGNLWGHWLEPVIAGAKPEFSWLAAGGGLAAMAIGIGVAFSMYSSGTRLPSEHPNAFATLLLNKWKVDEVYESLIVWPMRWVARFAAAFDKYFIDMLFAKATSSAVMLAGYLSTRMQTGVVFAYSTAMVVGVLGLGLWFAMPHPCLEVTKTEGSAVSFKVARGHGYKYRWDTDGDGEFEGTASEGAAAAELTHTFAGDELRGVALLVETTFGGKPVEVRIPTGTSVTIPTRMLGNGWAKASGTRAPVARAEGDTLVLRPNDAHAGRPGEELRLHVGDAIELGSRMVRIGAVVRVAVEVENALGVVRKAHEDLVVVPRAAKENPHDEAALVAPPAGTLGDPRAAFARLHGGAR